MTTRIRRSVRQSIPGTVVRRFIPLVVLIGGCSVSDGSSERSRGEADPTTYELEFVRCSVETDAEYAASRAVSSPGGDTSRNVIADYRVTNRDVIRRRFQIRGERTDAAGQDIPFTARQTSALDPGESSDERLVERVIDRDVPPYVCTAEVWDSVLDEAFPED